MAKVYPHRTGGPDPMARGSHRQPARCPVSDATKIEDHRAKHRAENACQDYEDGRQGRQAPKAFRNTHRDRRGHRLGRQRDERIPRPTQQPGQSDGGACSGQGSRRDADEHARCRPAHLIELPVERDCQRNRRRTEQEMHELRTIEIASRSACR